MRVALFYDGKNFYSGWKQFGNDARIDFNKLTEWLLKKIGGTNHVGSHYYTGVEPAYAELPETQGKLERFLSFIEVQRGFTVHRFGRKPDRYTCSHCGNEGNFTREKEVDTSLVADMVKLGAIGAYDVAVLLSGDSDYVPAIDSVQSLGKNVYIATWAGAGMSPRIRTAAFDHINLVNGIDYFTVGFDSNVRTEDEENVTENDEEDFLNELERAEDNFSKKLPGSVRSGYVGLGFFMTKWRAEKLSPLPEVRKAILDRLIESGDVEVYDAPDGKKAIRTVRSDDDEDEFDIRSEWEEEAA